MSLSFDFSQTPDDPTKIHEGGGSRPSPSRCMVVITKFDQFGGANGSAHVLEYEIVASTVPDDVGKTHDELIFHQDKTGKGWPMRRMTCLGMVTGLFNANDVKRWKDTGTNPDIDMTKIVGRPMMIELVEEQDANKPGKTYIKIGGIGLAMYHLLDPRVKDWPKNASLYNRLANTVGQWIVSESKAAAPAAKPPATAGSGPVDPFAAAT